MKKIVGIMLFFLLSVGNVTLVSAFENPSTEFTIADWNSYFTSTYILDTSDSDGKPSSIQLKVIKHNVFDRLMRQDNKYTLEIELINSKNRSNPFIIKNRQRPYLVLKKDGKCIDLIFKRIYGLNNHSVSYNIIKAKRIRPTREADAVYLMVYTENGSWERFLLPNEVIKQWDEVIGANMHKKRNEFTGKNQD